MQEGKLGPAIALSERVNSVELAEKGSGLCEKYIAVDARKEQRGLQPRKQQVHLPVYVLGKAEPVSALRGADGSVPASP
jgi:hypothetical protein